MCHAHYTEATTLWWSCDVSLSNHFFKDDEDTEDFKIEAKVLGVIPFIPYIPAY